MVDPQAKPGQDDGDIGARLKFIREHNGLSQRELAKRAGVPHSSISMIEQGQNSPSVNSLAKIVGGIPMSLAQFFACDISLLSQQIYRASDLANAQQFVASGIHRQRIPLHTDNSSLSFNRFCYAANSDTGENPIISRKGFGGFIVKGNIELTVNAEVSLLHSGDSFSVTAHQPHRLRNISPNEDCIVIICEF